MATVSIEEAQHKLPDLIHQLSPGEELIITVNGEPVARVIPTTKSGERKLGTMRGTVLSVAPDFDAPLEEFRDYMP